MSSEEHAVWEASADACESNPGAQGCVLRHAVTKALLKTPCDYQWNSLQICKAARSAPYQMNVRRGQPYKAIADAMRPNAAIVAYRESQGKSDGHKYFQLHFKNPANMLEGDPLAWNINHTVAHHLLPPWAGKKWPGKTAENFLPTAHGGLGSMIPYHHNHHHLIPNGAFRDGVILGPGLGKSVGERVLTAALRIAIVRLAKYNLNEEFNLCILPQQVHISAVVGLPAHCPYGARSHPAYSNMVKEELNSVRDTIDEAFGEAGDHKVLRKVVITLKALEQRLWRRVQFVEPVGAAIGKG